MNKYFPQKYVISYTISFIYGLITGKSVHLQSAPLDFSQNFRELPEEQQSTTNCRCRIGYCFSRIYTGYSHKVWQYQCQWDQQNCFAQQGYENRNFCLSQGYKHILAGSLQSENSHTTQENRHCPADCFYQSFITRKGGSYC